MVRCITLLILLAGAVRAQESDLTRAAQNPFDLARFIDSHPHFDWNELWKALQTEPMQIPDCDFMGQGCWTELIQVLDPDQVILLVQGDVWSDIYIRFLHEKNGGWKFSGVYPASIRFTERRHEIDRVGGKPFLVVSIDVNSRYAEWFDLTVPGFEPVFGFTMEGYLSLFTFDISRKVFATVLLDNRNQISVMLDVRFLGADGNAEYDLGRTFANAKYNRTTETGKFQFRGTFTGFGEHGPSLSESAFNALTDFESGPTNEEMVRYILPNLKEIARGKENGRRKWLRDFVMHAKSTPEIRELKALLQ